jgi:hypothetical protein
MSSKFGLTLRNEYFSDADARLMFSGIDNGGSIFATTLSANFRVGSCFAIIPEVRIDNASKNIFTDSKGNGSKQAGSAILAAIYTF